MTLPIHPVQPLPPIHLPTKTFYGKYRGTVLNNIDPQQIGRIEAQIPDVLGVTSSSWALPCVPAAGIQSGIFIVPPIGSSVWIEFEAGNPDHPIWTGGFWSTPSGVPARATAPAAVPPGQNIVLQTTGGTLLTLSDAPGPAGGIILQSPNGASITVNDLGIVLQNGKGAVISLVGPQVIFNNAAALDGTYWDVEPRTHT